MNTLDSNVPVRLSRFVHFVDFGKDTTAIYNALSQAVVYVPESVSAIIKTIGGKTLDEMTCKHFHGYETEAREFLQQLWHLRMLLEEGEDELVEVDLLKEMLEIPQITILYLILTDICNIGCKYCFFEGGIPEGHEFSMMSFETAKQGVDLFARSLNQDLLADSTEGPRIILYGGEALLNWDVGKQVLEYIEECISLGELPENTGITLNTNGILITPEIAATLAKHNVSVAISVDGPKEVHDLMRVDHLGKGTFDRVMHGLRTARQTGCNVSACCTIDEHNLDILPAVTTWLVKELDVQGFGFNTLLECNARRIERPLPYSHAVASALIESFKIARKHGVYEDRFMRKVNAFVEGNFYFSDCGGCGMQIVMSPEGYIGTCHAYCGTKEYFVRYDPAIDPNQHPFWREWRRRSPINMEGCYDCIALANCGGGCPHNAALVAGSIWEKDTSFCPHATEAVRFLIEDLYRIRSESQPSS